MKLFWYFCKLVLHVAEIHRMFSIKSESFDTLNVSNDDNSYICDALNTNTSDNPNISDTFITYKTEYRPDKSLSGDMLLTVGYVKSESTSQAYGYNTLNSKGNKTRIEPVWEPF